MQLQLAARPSRALGAPPPPPPSARRRPCAYARAAAAASAAASAGVPLAPRTPDDKAALVAALLQAKAASGKTFDAIAAEVGLTNVFTAALFYNQAQLSAAAAGRLAAAVPGLTPELLAAMRAPPLRSFDARLLQEPLVYRFYEAVMHNGEALKALVNERFGDGIMSAIDIYTTLGEAAGAHGERRVVVTLSGKFLPYVEQVASEAAAAQGR